MRGFMSVLLVLAAGPAARAQPPAEERPGTAPVEPVAIAVTAAVSVGASHVGPAVGAALSAGLTPRLSIEAQVALLDRGPGATAAAGLGGLLVHFAESRARVVPFAALGIGLYHARFRMGGTGMFGRYGWTTPPGPGMGVWYGPAGASGTGPLPWPAHVPRFYAARAGEVQPPLDGRWPTRSFTDLMAAMGAGARVELGGRLFLRPDARALVIFGNGDTHAVSVLSIGVGARF